MTQKTLDKTVKTLYDSGVATLFDQTRSIQGVERYGFKVTDEKTQEIMLASAQGAAIGALAASWGIPEAYIPQEVRELLFKSIPGFNKSEFTKGTKILNGLVGNRPTFGIVYPNRLTGIDVVSNEFDYAVIALDKWHVIDIEKKYVRHGHFYETRFLGEEHKQPELQERLKLVECVLNEV